MQKKIFFLFKGLGCPKTSTLPRVSVRGVKNFKLKILISKRKRFLRKTILAC